MEMNIDNFEMEFDVEKFEIEEIESIEAPGDGWFWAGVGVGVVVGIALC